MTIPEINRHIKAWGWREERKNQFIASALYKLPPLIGVAMLDSKKYPEIYEIFPTLFKEEEIKDAQQTAKVRKDVDTFKAWAEGFNKKFERENDG